MTAERIRRRDESGRQVPYQPTDEGRQVVKTLVAGGAKRELIAKALGISKPTLIKFFRDEIDTSVPLANAKVIGNLFRIATARQITGPVVAAAIFWTKVRCGFNERAYMELTGADGGPIETVSGKMTPKQAAEAYARTLKGSSD